MIALKHAAATALLAVSALAVAAPAHADRWHYLIDQRAAEHQRLITQGVANGSLTRIEASDLRSYLASVRRGVREARRDGRLTDAERETIRMQQDYLSEQIFADRNNSDRRW